METSSKAIPHRAPLDVFFRPRNVAVIGATEDQAGVGRSLVFNLKQTSFGGSIYPVNLKTSQRAGFALLAEPGRDSGKSRLGGDRDTARTVPGVVGECVAAGVEGATIISAGFMVIGERGAALEQEILQQAGRMRIVGPNCLVS